MNRDEAIKHCEEVAQEKRYEYQESLAVHDMEEAEKCEKCGEEHEQLAEWLKELRKFREQEPCEDCISREAVIEHICENKECYKEECKGRTLKRCIDLQWAFDLPSVTPQPYNAESKEQESVLDKISAEIMQLDYDTETVDYDYNDMAQTEVVHMICREEVLQIIDKYKVESR